MADNLSKEDRRKNMQSIRSKNTKLEEKVTKELWRRGFRFRKNVKSLFGKPDIAIKKYKLVIFIDSCFWHGCRLHCRIPRSNKEYWVTKLRKNKLRDIEVTNYYHSQGWKVIRVWEHQLKDDFENTIEYIAKSIKRSKIGY